MVKLYEESLSPSATVWSVYLPVPPFLSPSNNQPYQIFISLNVFKQLNISLIYCFPGFFLFSYSIIFGFMFILPMFLQLMA